LRKHVQNMSDGVKAAVASYEKLDAIIWYHEELVCATVNEIISQRLKSGEIPNLPYGKLMERLLYCKMNKFPFADQLIPVAEKRLEQIHLPLDPPVVVLGDASYSMDVAIRTATVIGSLLTALANADLRFFNVASLPPHVVPRTIQQVLDVATQTRADGLTAPACTLLEYYKKKQIVKFFVMVTDEIENIPSEGHYFAQLFWKYSVEVYPAKLVFVSFLENPKEKGRMVTALESLGITPLQFRLDAKRPDLTKVDTLLGLLSSETEAFCTTTDHFGSLLSKGADIDQIKLLLNVVPERSQSNNNNSANTNKGDAAPVDLAGLKISEPKKDDKKEEKKEKKEELKESKGGKDEQQECSICMVGKCDSALVDCGHVFCNSCANPLKECPLCRQKVLKVLRLFKS